MLGVLACSNDHAGERQGAARTGSGPVSAEKPAPFNAGPVKIALVQYSGAGDYFEQWTAGARAQGKVAGFDIQTYDAQADPAKQASDMDAAIASGVKGIIVDHGLARPMCPVIRKATDAGIAVVVYDIEITQCAPKAVQTAQNDADLATRVLTQMAKDLGDGISVGYVTVFGIAPFDRRDAVWKKFRTEHKWKQKFVTGKFTKAVAADNIPLVAGVLKLNPQVKAIFASYDELTKATLSALEQHGPSLKVAVYGIDISKADIELMTKKDSPWKATATTDPRAVGAAVTRTLALQLAGQLGSKEVVFPGALVTQAFLLENRIKNMDDLRDKLPALNLDKVSSAGWLGSVSF
ncbi:MAG: substrate-binding domain-containing protein [Gemmatimonadales bacterium]